MTRDGIQKHGAQIAIRRAVARKTILNADRKNDLPEAK
jgi:hypothetical protein